MNKDQVKGAAKQVTGEVQEQVGKLTGDTSTRVKGHAKEMEGKVQSGVGDAKEALHESQRDLDTTRDQNRKLDR